MFLYLVGDGERLVDPRLYLAYFDSRPAVSAMVFVLAFTICTALSLPVSGVLAVVSGMIFGVAVGTPVALWQAVWVQAVVFSYHAMLCAT